ncbi:MAG: AI-2E family transporter [Deltaproteobacteria bacterium]|nr:AI-2E family transporter [Candidatus Tharpella sp.]
MIKDKLSVYKIIVFFVALLLSVGLFIWMISPFLVTLILSLIMVGLCHPFYRKLVEICDGRSWMASSMICLAIFLGIFVPLVFLITSLSVEVAEFYSYLRRELTVDSLNHLISSHSDKITYLTDMLDRLGINYNLTDMQNDVIRLSKEAGFWVYNWTRVLAGQIMNFSMHFVLLIIFVYFLLIDGLKVKEYLLALSPLPRNQEELLLHKINDMTLAMVVGNGMAAIVQGILGGVGLAFFEIKSPILWGTVMAIFAFIPFIGISVVFIPIGAYMLLIGETGRGIAFLVSFGILSLVVEYLVKPKLVGDRVKIHILLIFISIFGGLATFGLLGIIFGPLITIAFLVWLKSITRVTVNSYFKIGKRLNERKI